MESSENYASGVSPGPSGTIIVDTVEMAIQMSKMKADRYTHSYYDRDDISQEIWLICHKVEPKFDPERTKNPKTFFNVATENALKNLRRDTRIADRINIADRNIEEMDNSFEEFLELRDMVEYLIVNIPSKLRKPLSLMINLNGDGVSPYMKAKVRKAVLRLLEKFKEDV